MTQNNINTDRISEQMRKRNQWVCWTNIEKRGAMVMVPKDPETMDIANMNDPNAGGSFDDARTILEEEDLKGLGYVFTENGPFVGVDIDDCRDPETGDIEDWVLDILQTLDGWIEISPSETGVHIIVSGDHPGDKMEQKRGYVNTEDNVEIYEQNRFFTVTGNLINENGEELTDEDETPEIEDNQQGLNALYERLA